MIGIIIFCIICFVIFFGYHIVTFVYEVGQLILMTIAAVAEMIYRHFTIERRIQKEDKIKEAERIEKMNKIKAAVKERADKNIRYENTMVMGVFNKIRELRFKYPQADSKLFDEYQNGIYDLSIVELDQIENKIAQSHIYNIKNKGKEVPTYNYSDVEGVTPLEEIRESPLYIKLVRKGNHYVAIIQNSLHGQLLMYQSTNYIMIMDLCNAVLNQIQGLKQAKQEITAVDIDNIFKYNSAGKSDIEKLDCKIPKDVQDRLDKRFRGGI